MTEEGEFLVSNAIARSLVKMGKRALVVDLSGKAPGQSTSRTLKRVLNALEHHPLKLAKKLTVLRGALATSGNQSPVTSPSFPRLLEQAREQCDLVIIGTPPVMISADALYLGRHADFVLHVVRWNSTPRRAVLAALEQLRNFGIPVDGVILSRMHEKEFWRLTGVAEKSQRKGWKDWKTRQATSKRGRAGSAEVFARELSLARRVLTEDRRQHDRKNYSLHVPEGRRERLPPKVRGRRPKLRLRQRRLRCLLKR